MEPCMFFTTKHQILTQYVKQAKRKRIAELSVATLPLENRRKSHWQYVLDEMAWLANDFAQERLWKITAAAQISQRVAFASHLRHQEKNSRRKQKEVAHNLAKAVMEFWHSVEGTNKELELQHPGKAFGRAVQGYALRFLKHNNSHGQDGQAEAPLTPDRISDLGTLDMSWEDQLTEEILFYTVPLGAMEAYRKSVESRVLKFEVNI
ncbi:hypothetical protein RJ639_046365 [Escallonia herrerae]|uniref:HSA domain-containing protein n=1 Tax=Escallonia herrerae TaxID=1293975 RepID=A0AA88W5U0_9ASTE|nr:hypothetical protein RJ639_046365 [Escallonia herrerae]